MEIIMKNKLKNLSLGLIGISLITSCSAFRSDTQYYINFEENGGSKVNNLVIDLEKFDGFPEDTFLDNFTFIGWFFEDDFIHEFSLKHLTENYLGGRNTINLYAYWVSDDTYNQKYLVNFIPNNGYSINPQEYGFYEQVTSPETPTKPYAQFAGWYLEASFKSRVDFANFRVKNNISFHGKWIQKYQLIYDLLDDGFHLIAFEDNQYTYNRESIELEDLNDIGYNSEGYLVEDIGGYISYTVFDYRQKYQSGGSFPTETNINIEIDYEKPDFAYFNYNWGNVFDDPTVSFRGKIRINKTGIIGNFLLTRSIGNSSRIEMGKESLRRKITLILSLVNGWHNPKQANISWD